MRSHMRKSKARSRSFSASSAKNARDIARLNYRTGGFSGLEVKFFDSSITNANPSVAVDMSGGEVDPVTVACLNAMTQGNGASQRLGRHISMRSISVRGRVSLPQVEAETFPPGNVHVLIVLVLDKQTNASQMSSEDVFVNESASVNTNASVFRNMQHTDRFTVLATRKMIIEPHIVNEGAVNAFAHGQEEKTFSMHVKLRNKKVLFADAGGTVSNIQDNSLHMLFFANDNALNIDYNARLLFTTT